MRLTEAQRELLEDKFVLWDRASREGNMEMRDYNRRAADALKAALSICAEAPTSSAPDDGAAPLPETPESWDELRRDRDAWKADAKHYMNRLHEAESGDGWLTIDSAPRDGRDVLLWGVHRHDGQRHFVGGWWPAEEDWSDEDGRIIKFDPTHWRPLPPGPGGEA